MSMLAEMTWPQWLLASVLVFACFLLMLVILLQKGRGGGFSGAFGGAGGSSAFGAKTGDVFTWVTVAMAAVFVVLTVWGNFVFDESLRPKLETGATAQPTIVDFPLEELNGAGPSQPVKIELGIVDPTTGERSTVLVPAEPTTPQGGAPPAGEADGGVKTQPTGGAQPTPPTGDEATPPAKETPPEGEKKDESENRPSP